MNISEMLSDIVVSRQQISSMKGENKCDQEATSNFTA
jgi:hypothetical protein